MLLRNAIEQSRSLSYIVNGLDLQSGLARRVLLDTEFITVADKLQQSLDDVEQLVVAQANPQAATLLDDIRVKLAQVRDIKATIDNLARHATLDDIELYEVKHFCLLTDAIAKLLSETAVATVQLPNLTEAIRTLDPDEQRIPHFYIYDGYSQELAGVREKMAVEKASLAKLNKEDSKEYKEKEALVDELYFRSVSIEDEVRTTLAERLRPYAKDMSHALTEIARLDILIAKAQQAIVLELSKPEISADKTAYSELFNPLLKSTLESNGKPYQPVSIEFGHAPCLITGANMSGKTVLLKTLQLAQLMFQFGFYIPAAKAAIAIVDEVLVSTDDGQEELKGLSSYASEMLTINDMLTAVKSGKRTLLLIDELARTTNPTEGKAIVNAMLDLLTQYKVSSIITTHYSGIQSACKRLRVKGFIEEKVKGTLSKSNINEYIDYRLVEEEKEEVPMDAIRVAAMLGVSNELLAKAKLYITGE